MSFAYHDGLTNSKNLLKDLGGQITKAYSQGTNNWKILKEEKDSSMRTVKLYLSGKTDAGTNMYIMFDHSNAIGGLNLKYVNVQCAEVMSESSGVVNLVNPTDIGKFHWVAETSNAPRDESTPISYQISLTNNRLILTLQGDPTIDFAGYVKNVLYFGAMNSMDSNDKENICLTYGSDVSTSPTTTYGQYTSNGLQTIAVLKTKSGVLWQRHYPAFITQIETLPLESTGFNASRWTGKYHLSPIYVVHPYDGYRGTLDGLIGVNKNNILHLDELLVETDDPTIKDRYKYFDANSKYDFLENSPHKNEGLALLKSPGENTP